MINTFETNLDGECPELARIFESPGCFKGHTEIHELWPGQNPEDGIGRFVVCKWDRGKKAQVAEEEQKSLNVKRLKQILEEEELKRKESP